MSFYVKYVMCSFMRSLSFRVAGKQLSTLIDKNNQTILIRRKLYRYVVMEKWIKVVSDDLCVRYMYIQADIRKKENMWNDKFLFYIKYKNILPKRWLSGQQINCPIFLQYTYMIFLAIDSLFIKKKPI